MVLKQWQMGVPNSSPSMSVSARTSHRGSKTVGLASIKTGYALIPSHAIRSSNDCPRVICLHVCTARINGSQIFIYTSIFLLICLKPLHLLMDLDPFLCHDLFVSLFRILGKLRHHYHYLFSYVSEHEHSFVFCSFCLWIMIDDHYGVY